MQSPQGLLGKSEDAAEAGRDWVVFPEDRCAAANARKWCARKIFRSLDFPILQCWPQDGGRYITWPMVITKNPETGKRNVGCYRMQVLTNAPPECTGRRRSMAPNTSAARARKIRREDSKWPSRLEPIRPLAWPEFCRFRRIWTNFCFRDFCAAIRWSWCSARRWIWKSRPTRRSFWKDM